MDILTKIQRSERMRRVRQKGTAPEIEVRRLLFRMGYRYRVNVRKLPGSPDIVFPGRRKAIFVHGCFWHSHDDPICPLATKPKSNRPFWEKKLRDNRDRDVKKLSELGQLGWQSFVIWQCQLKNVSKLKQLLKIFLR
ncbi:MAG: DNA mismatch endonuclease Vsr [Proteobacteria bacterium]|nr:DNA mismatch endonuclease Vsr [Pseudomonadota bacterium]